MSIRSILEAYGKAIDPQGLEIQELDVAEDEILSAISRHDLSQPATLMSVRQWYAGQALPAIIRQNGSAFSSKTGFAGEPAAVATAAFADAMIAESRKEAP